MGDADITLRHISRRHAEGSPFWLVFTPLARDATIQQMRAVVGEIRAAVPAGDDRWELFAGLLVMADLDTWGHNLRAEIEAMIQHEPTDLIQVSKTLRDAFERGQREGIEHGVQRMLRQLFAKRLHRALTAREQEALAARAAADPEQIQDKILALEGEALSAWLLSNGAS